MSGAERRRFVRVKLASEVEIVAGLVHSKKPRTLRGSCLDVSVDGALLLLGEPLEMDDEILVSFFLKREPIECAAIVLRVQPSAKKGRWKIGCQFQGVSENTYRQLSRYIADKLQSSIPTPR